MSNPQTQADRTAADIRREREQAERATGPKLPGELADWKIALLVGFLAVMIIFFYFYFRGV